MRTRTGPVHTVVCCVVHNVIVLDLDRWGVGLPPVEKSRGVVIANAWTVFFIVAVVVADVIKMAAASHVIAPLIPTFDLAAVA